MDGILFDVDRSESDLDGWTDLVRPLTQEGKELREEIVALRLENLEWRQQAGYWKSMHARALERIAGLEQENEHRRGENRRLQEQQFGKKSEKQSSQDRSNHLDGLEKDKPKADPTKPKKGPTRRDNSLLPIQEVLVELPADERACPICGKPRQEMTATEDSEQIENASERSLRGAALGRKNYYGSQAEWSGRLAMMLFSLFATLPMWKINPRTWLRWYLDACAAVGGQAPADVQPYLPWNLSEEQRQVLSKPIPLESQENVSDRS